MQILCELVTVIKEQKPICHWETGKAVDVMIFKSGDLPVCCTETFMRYRYICFEPRVTGCTCEFAEFIYRFCRFLLSETFTWHRSGKGFFTRDVFN